MNVKGYIVFVYLRGLEHPVVYEDADCVDIGIFVTVDYGRNTARFFTSNLERLVLERKHDCVIGSD